MARTPVKAVLDDIVDRGQAQHDKASAALEEALAAGKRGTEALTQIVRREVERQLRRARPAPGACEEDRGQEGNRQEAGREEVNCEEDRGQEDDREEDRGQEVDREEDRRPRSPRRRRRPRRRPRPRRPRPPAEVRRRLDAELVRRGLARSRADAVDAVQQGRITVAGAPADNPARQVSDADPIERAGEPSPYVSRGGLKLAAALDAFALDPTGGTWLDAARSTGGFTDCLLQRGAACVHAVDVGHGQLAWSLQSDPRVVVHDRNNVRNLEPDDIGGPVDGCVADLSFISLRTVAPALVRCTSAAGDFVLLVKPQFEAGRSRVGKGGVIRDPSVHAAVLVEVAGALADHGLVTVAAIASPIHGADGNREFLYHGRRTGRGLAEPALEALATGNITGNVTQPGGPSGENVT